MEIKNVALVEDDKGFRDILAKMINQEIYLNCIYQFKNSSEAQELETEDIIDLFVLDIKLPDMNGIDLLRILKKKYDNSKFIMCSTFDERSFIIESLKSGANGYIVKSDSPHEILHSIHMVLSNKSPLSDNVSNQLVKYFNESKVRSEKLNTLTLKEMEVLEMLSKGLLYKEIADIQKVALITIKKHCSSIYLKLNVTNKTEALNLYHNI